MAGPASDNRPSGEATGRAVLGGQMWKWLGAVSVPIIAAIFTYYLYYHRPIHSKPYDVPREPGTVYALIDGRGYRDLKVGYKWVIKSDSNCSTSLGRMAQSSSWITMTINHTRWQFGRTEIYLISVRSLPRRLPLPGRLRSIRKNT